MEKSRGGRAPVATLIEQQQWAQMLTWHGAIYYLSYKGASRYLKTVLLLATQRAEERMAVCTFIP